MSYYNLTEELNRMRSNKKPEKKKQNASNYSLGECQTQWESNLALKEVLISPSSNNDG